MVTFGDHVLHRVPEKLVPNNEFFDGKHRFEHWYRDNTVYFITSKVRDGVALFEKEGAKAIFWDRWHFY